MLTIKNIYKRFGGVHALKNVSTIFYNEEIHGVVGENGAGKSTLMKIIAGVYNADGGYIELDGEKVHFQKTIDAYNAGIRIVHQDLSLIQSLSIAENIFIHEFRKGSFIKLIKHKKYEEKAKELLKNWEINLDPRTLIKDIPIGLKQLIEVARELNTNGKIIILDEPTSSLTSIEIERLFNFLKKLRDKGHIVIFISHRLNEVIEIVDRVTVLRDGKVVAREKINNLSPDKICNLVAGKSISELYPKAKVKIGKTSLEVNGLTGKGFQDISFQVKHGEIIAIVGLMGSGRSELLKAIFGVNKIYCGEACLDGNKILIKNSNEMLSQGFAFLSENRIEEGTFPDLTVSNNIIIIKLKEVIENLIIRSNKVKKQINYIIKKLGIITYNPLSQLISQLSGGNQQKAIFGRLLYSNPRILLLDEPTRGIDIASKIEIHRIMGDYIKNGRIIIMVTSEIDEAMTICDRIIVMSKGKIVGRFTKNKITKEKLLKCMMGLTKKLI